MAAETTTNAGLPLDELVLRPEWACLTEKQKRFTSLFIQSGDALFAVNSTYNCKTEWNAKLLSYEILKNPKVEAVLELYKPTTREEFFARLQKKIEHDDLSVAQIEGIKLLCAERGWAEPSNLPRINGYKTTAERKAAATKSELKHFVGEIIHQADGDYEVLAVDSKHTVTSVRNRQTGQIEVRS
jgi:hypothetical protein